jgi:predicted enzyme related to lactoylglutathione lyase
MVFFNYGLTKESEMANQVVWCDIPVRDLERAIRFYSAVLGHDVKRHDFSGVTVGILPHNDGEVGGCLLTSSEEQPGKDGVMI